MKYTPRFPPAAPYRPFPPEAIQYTRCLLAISVCKAFCEEIRPPALPVAVLKRLEKIKTRLAEMGGALKKDKPLSAVAKRSLDTAFKLIADRCVLQSDDKNITTDALRWYDAVYLAHLLLIDCLCTCPAYFNSAAWSWLFHHMYCLADFIDAHAPEAANAAGDIHMEIDV